MHDTDGIETEVKKEIPMHFVCTRDDASKMIDAQQKFWVSNCGCREGNPDGCKHSRTDVCLMFEGEEGSSGSGKREISKAEAVELIKEAKEKKLVCRPFRNTENMITEGVCFCCDDCCGYFLGDDYACDKGTMIEQTDEGSCSNCGGCVDFCYFGARKIEDGKLVVNKDKCYGCALCVDDCPDCIQMVLR